MFIAGGSRIVKGGSGETSGPVIARRDVGGLPASGVRGIRLCSLLFRFHRAGMLCVFVLAFCLLGAGDARAGETELFSLTFKPDTDSSNYFSSSQTSPSSVNKDYRFVFDGVTYALRQAGVINNSYFEIEISPRFPPDGQVRSKFDLHVGVNSSGQYRENAKLNFNNVQYSLNRDDRNSWSGAGGATNGWSRSQRTAVIKISGPETPNNTLQLAGYPESPDEDTGRLEIFDASAGDNGQWKWVCDDGFGEKEAQVACGELGLPTSGAATWEMPSGWLNPQGSGFSVLLEMIIVTLLSDTPALLDDVDCDGEESKLIDCDHAGRGVSDCELSEAAGVTCQEKASDDADE